MHEHDHGHEHHHNHDDCCCGHDHEQEHHHHHDDDDCCCGHDQEQEHHHHHDDDCCCGHHHEHHHHDGCCCGHDHDHEAEAQEDVPTRSHTHFVVEHVQTPGHPADCQCPLCCHHAEYCDICGESLAKCTCKMPDEDLEKRVYILEGIDCANCAAKIEAKIRSMPEVAFATVSFATKQLRVAADNQDALLPKMQAVVDSIEDGVTLVPRKRRVSGMAPTRVYILEGLDCANCAAKIEKKLQTLPGVDEVTITFATKQMRLSAKDPDSLIPQIQQTINAMEDGVTVVPKESAPAPKDDEAEEKKELRSLIVGAVLFVAGEILEHLGAPTPVLLGMLAVAYLILGGEVLMASFRNIKKGQIFDENFLMSIATLGAFAIGDFPEAVGVMLFYRIGEYFEDRAVSQSRKQIMDAVDLRPEVVNLVVGEDIRVIDAEEANVGDILLVRPGDRIPLDGVIIEGESRIDTSPVTGEPVPVKAAVGDSVISGCVNTSGTLKIRAEKLLEESMVTRILDSVENAAANKPNIDKFITRFARVYTPAVVISALVVALVLPFLIPGWHFFVDPAYTGAETVLRSATGTASVFTALTFLVISCPCALVLSVPLAFFSGIGAASKKNILFKGGNAIEALSGVKAVVMDKTGTITKGNFVVQSALPAGEGISEAELLAMAASCELFSTHPIAVSIVTAAQEKGISIEKPANLQEIAGQGIAADTSLGKLLCGNRKLLEAHGVDLSDWQEVGFGTQVLIARNGKFVGNIVISDTLKEDAVEAIGKIRKQGIVTAMLTGDAQDSAEFVAKETGIDEVHAKLLPENKLETLHAIREAHGSVMFVGDGINDAPVLAGADVGAIEAADVVFMTSEMSAIPEALRIAKATRRISWQNVYFALAVKLIVMIMGLCGYANMWVAVFADTGVSMLCLLNSVRILRMK